MSANNSAKTHRLLRSVHFTSGGFLLAVLWMDLMFDTLVLQQDFGTSQLPSESLQTIQVYYRRVTNGADPMRFLVGLAMILFAVGGVYLAVWSRGRSWLRFTSGLLATLTVGLALFRIVPNAQKLVFDELPVEAQSELAWSVFQDHICCFVAVTSVLCIQLVLQVPDETA